MKLTLLAIHVNVVNSLIITVGFQYHVHIHIFYLFQSMSLIVYSTYVLFCYA